MKNRTGTRRLLACSITCALAASALVLAPAQPAAAADPPPPPSLIGSDLRATSGIEVAGTCGPWGASQYTYEVSGQVDSGAWSGGTFTETGEIVLGTPGADGVTAPIVSVRSSFTIVHRSATITGTKTYARVAGTPAGYGVCQERFGLPTRYFFSSDANLTYEASYHMGGGRTCTDRGGASMQLGKGGSVSNDSYSGRHLLLGAFVRPMCTTPTPQPPSGSFAWSVEDRFGRDDNGDGLIDDVTTPAQVAQPWTVTFDACRSQNARTYEWQFPTRRIPAGGGCFVSEQFTAEGTYPVTLTVTNDVGSHRTTQWVTIHDWLIVSLGDSSASGEGSPDFAQFSQHPAQTRWQNSRCHRSAAAGSAKAALAIEQADPHSTVTFVHLACSGSGIVTGLLEPAPGNFDKPYNLTDCAQQPELCIPPQVDEVDRLVGDRTIDAMVITAGANDLNFVSIVEECLRTIACHVTTAAVLLEDGLRRVGPAYDQLAARLDRLVDSQGRRLVAPDRVFVTEYHDVSYNERAEACTIGNPFTADGAINPRENAWASANVIGGLTRELQSASAEHGYRFVGGIADAFRGHSSPDPAQFRPGHGYCTAWPGPVERWVGTVEESLFLQGTVHGAFHPNYAGQRFIGQRIGDELRATMLADGTPPTIVARGGFADGGRYAGSVTPAVAVDDDGRGVATVTFRLDGSAWSYGGIVDQVGHHTLSVTATDRAGNATTVSFGFDVVDTEPPTVTAPPDVDVDTDPGRPSASVDVGMASATDNVAVRGVVGARGDGRPLGEPYPIGATTITWTATDTSGNTASAVQDVTVHDREPPQLGAAPDISTGTDEARADARLSIAAPPATDNAPGVTVRGSRSDGASLGEPYPLGTTTIRWTATDGSGNTASADQRVVVVDDEAPTWAVSAVVANATSSAGATVTYAHAVADNVEVVTSFCEPAPGTLFAIGTTTVGCSARDAAGNTGSTSFTVTVRGADGQLADLRTAVADMGLPNGTANSFDVQLRDALTEIAAGRTTQACQKLADFASHARAQSGKKLTTAQATRMITDAERIRAVIGC